MEGNRSLLIRMLRYVPDRLARVTDSTRFIPEIDGLRFVAIMSVVWYHLLGVISVRKLGSWEPAAFDGIPVFSTLTSGHFGVPLFFVISGFILAVPFAYQHLKEAPAKPLKQYYLRRLSRLGPPYVVWLCILFAAQVMRGQAPLSDWPHLAASLGYVHNMVYGVGSTIMSGAWSLEVEVQFYCIAPLLCRIYLMKGRVVRRAVQFAVILAAGWAIEEWMPQTEELWNGNAWQMSVLNYFGYFMAGLLLADLHVSREKREDGVMVKLAWDAAAVVAWVWAWRHVKGGSGYQILLPVAVLVAYLGSMRGLLFSTVFRNKVIYTIGGTCYTIYLWHQPVLMAWGRYGLPRFWREEWSLGANVALQAVLATLLVLPVCAVLFVFLEKPFMKPRWWVKSGGDGREGR